MIELFFALIKANKLERLTMGLSLSILNKNE